MARIDPAEIDRLTSLVEEKQAALLRMGAEVLGRGERIAALEEQLAKAHNCASCGTALGHYCARCQKAWES